MTNIENWQGRASEETKRPEDDGKAGFKTDHGKLRYVELAQVYSYGANKYPTKNWEKGMAWSRPYGALLRHVFAWASSESRDPETGLHHLAQAAWNCFTLMCYDVRGLGENDMTKLKKTYRAGWRPVTDQQLGDFEDPDPESWPNVCPKFGAACKIGNGSGCSKSCFYFPKRAEGENP